MSLNFCITSVSNVQCHSPYMCPQVNIHKSTCMRTLRELSLSSDSPQNSLCVHEKRNTWENKSINNIIISTSVNSCINKTLHRTEPTKIFNTARLGSLLLPCFYLSQHTPEHTPAAYLPYGIYSSWCNTAYLATPARSGLLVPKRSSQQVSRRWRSKKRRKRQTRTLRRQQGIYSRAHVLSRALW